jgi:NAD(P)-dependent dehydrogenase (short-subunit alcohol dehydrogenase family)
MASAFFSSLPAWVCNPVVAFPLGVLAAAGGARLWVKWSMGINKHTPDMSKKVVLITGSLGGIGIETARELLKLNATVVMTGRSADRVDAAVKALRDEKLGGTVEGIELDLASRESVVAAAKSFSARHSRLDRLINNAGIMLTVGRDRVEKKFSDADATEEGFEEQFLVNVIGHTLLTTLLMPALKASPEARVVDVASSAHAFAPSNFYEDLQSKSWTVGSRAYGISKLSNMLHARGLSNRLAVEAPNVTAYSLHPGYVATELMRNTDGWVQTLLWPFEKLGAKTPWEGAQTTLHVALAPREELQPGAFYADCGLGRVRAGPEAWCDEFADEYLKALEDMAATGVPLHSIGLPSAGSAKKE